MYNSIEVFAIIFIIVVQVIITLRAYIQIRQLNSFLPKGRSSLTLKEYEIPSEKILDMDPSQVINKITYIVNKKERIIAEPDSEVNIPSEVSDTNEEDDE